MPLDPLLLNPLLLDPLSLVTSSLNQLLLAFLWWIVEAFFDPALWVKLCLERGEWAFSISGSGRCFWWWRTNIFSGMFFKTSSENGLFLFPPVAQQAWCLDWRTRWPICEILIQSFTAGLFLDTILLNMIWTISGHHSTYGLFLDAILLLTWAISGYYST